MLYKWKSCCWRREIYSVSKNLFEKLKKIINLHWLFIECDFYFQPISDVVKWSAVKFEEGASLIDEFVEIIHRKGFTLSQVKWGKESRANVGMRKENVPPCKIGSRFPKVVLSCLKNLNVIGRKYEVSDKKQASWWEQKRRYSTLSYHSRKSPLRVNFMGSKFLVELFKFLGNLDFCQLFLIYFVLQNLWVQKFYDFCKPDP